MDFHSALSDEGVGEFVSLAGPSSVATRQRKEVGEAQGGLCVSLCIQYSKLSMSLLSQSYRHAQCTGYRHLKSMGFMQRLGFFVEGGKVTSLSKVIIAMMSTEDLKREKESLFINL